MDFRSKMPSYLFLERDGNIHKELIQKVYKSWIDDNNDEMIRVILKDKREVKMPLSVFKMFSSYSPLLNSENIGKSAIFLPDFGEECLISLIEILSNGVSKRQSLKDPREAVEETKLLARSLGIEVRNLHPTPILGIKPFAQLLANVPNIMVGATDGKKKVDDKMQGSIHDLSDSNNPNESFGDDDEFHGWNFNTIGDGDKKVDDKLEGSSQDSSDSNTPNDSFVDDVEGWKSTTTRDDDGSFDENENEQATRIPPSPKQVTKNFLNNLLNESPQVTTFLIILDILVYCLVY